MAQWQRTHFDWDRGLIIYSHQGGHTGMYHKQCVACQRNFAVYKEMDDILRQHPDWGESDWK